MSAAWLDTIKRQICPLCGAGPFTVVAKHVSGAHGILALELRDMMGIPRSESICDPHHADSLRMVAIANQSHHRTETRDPDKNRVTVAKASAVARDRSQPKRDARTERIVELASSGTTLLAIAETVRCDEQTVRRALRSAGVSKPRTPNPAWGHAARVTFNCANCGAEASRPKANFDRDRRVVLLGLCCSRRCSALLREARKRHLSVVEGEPA